MIDRPAFWLTVALLGVLTAAIRLSFLVLLRDPPSERVRRLLRFVPVAVLPALMAPIVVFPQAAEAFDPPRLAAIAAALVVGALSRNMLVTIVAGMAVLQGLETVIG